MIGGDRGDSDNSDRNSRGGRATVDFMYTNPDSVDQCHATASGNRGLDASLTAIRSAIGDNIACILLAAGVVAASLAVVWYAAGALWGVFAEWRKHQLPLPVAAPLADKSHDGDDDDAVYASDVSADGIQMDLGPPPAAPIIAAQMATLTTKYDKYNAAMRQRAAAKGVEADDIIDERILGRDDDDWATTPTRPGPAAATARRDGAHGAYGGHGAAPTSFALRSPVYNVNPGGVR